MNAETGDRPNGKGNIPMLDLSARFRRDTRVLWRQRDPADQPGEILLPYGITPLGAEQSPPAANYHRSLLEEVSARRGVARLSLEEIARAAI